MHQATIPAAFLLGVFVGMCEFPCTGGPYLMVLGLLHDQTTYWSGVIYLLIYNLIFVSPLVVILLIAGDEAILEKIKRWKSKKLNRSRLIGGIIMIAIGLIIFLL
jgi:cytochrome c biogenesis protein CcdA